jgi:hypothetical protein
VKFGESEEGEDAESEEENEESEDAESEEDEDEESEGAQQPIRNLKRYHAKQRHTKNSKRSRHYWNIHRTARE